MHQTQISRYDTKTNYTVCFFSFRKTNITQNMSEGMWRTSKKEKVNQIMYVKRFGLLDKSI